MTTNSKKIILYSVIVAVVIIIVGIALMNTSKNAEQKQEATAKTNSLVDKPLPEIQLKDKDGRVYDIESLKGKNVVLFFNEGLMCYPACWNQMAAFGTDERFNNGNIVALSVIADSPQEWQKASSKMPELAKASILFDAAASTSSDSTTHHAGSNPMYSTQLGLLSVGSSMHPGQSLGHTYILLDKQGIVREVLDDPNMAVNNDMIIDKISKF